MELTYGGFELHGVGELEIVSSRSFEPPENPQQARVTLKVSIDIFPANYHAGRLVMDTVTAALRKQNEILKWVNPAAPNDEKIYVEQPAVVLTEDLPDDPNAWGSKYQRVIVTFSYLDRLTEGEAQNLTATFTKTGGSATALGKVSSFKERYEASRFLPTSSVRSRAVNVVSLSGRFVATPSDALAVRRTALLAAKLAMQVAVNGKEGLLKYVTPDAADAFSKTVRVKGFNASVDQAINGIDWSLEAEYTAFPSEATFGTVDYDVDEKQGRADGQLAVSFTGKVQAPSKALALSSLSLVRAVVLGNYAVTVLDDSSLTENAVEADDGSVFLELTFSESYLAFEVQTAGIKSVQFGHSVSLDPVSASKRVRLSGSVFGTHQLLLDCQGQVTGNFLDKFIGSLSLVSGDGRLVKRDVTIDHEYVPSEFTSNAAALGAAIADRAQKLDFTIEYEDSMTPAESILECEVSEEVQYSGNRLVVHPIPGGYSVVQNTGVEPGSRRVSGSVLALTYAVAEAYAIGKRSLLTGYGSPVVNAPRPEKLTTGFEFRPLTVGIADGVRETSTTNVRAVRVRFDFSEILADYPVP